MNNYYEYKVSKKTITLRMYCFLKETMQGVYAGIESKDDKKLALERVRRVHNNLLRCAIGKGTPQNTIDCYQDAFDKSCMMIENKELK